jgi:hypothetical protein
MIEAGDKSQIRWGEGNWIFLDIGFANQRPSCGLAIRDDSPTCLCFADATKRVIEELRKSQSGLNLVVEAPLSVCFDSFGNPKPRRIEKDGKKGRYWYVGPGCVVMVAATYLIRAIHQTRPDVPVRLFEGFVSFKDKSSRNRDKEDVRRLREVVRNPRKFSDSIYTADQLSDTTDSLCSAFTVAGMDCGIPVVIKVPGSP